MHLNIVIDGEPCYNMNKSSHRPAPAITTQTVRYTQAGLKPHPSYVRNTFNVHPDFGGIE